MSFEYDSVLKKDGYNHYDFILIRSNHIGTIPLNGHHVEDLMEISYDSYELVATRDESVSDNLKFYEKKPEFINAEYIKYIEDIYKALIEQDPIAGKIPSALLAVHNINCCFGHPNIIIWNYIEKAWGDQSRNNCSYLKADRISEEYTIHFKKDDVEKVSILVWYIDC